MGCSVKLQISRALCRLNEAPPPRREVGGSTFTKLLDHNLQGLHEIRDAPMTEPLQFFGKKVQGRGHGT